LPSLNFEKLQEIKLLQAHNLKTVLVFKAYVFQKQNLAQEIEKQKAFKNV